MEWKKAKINTRTLSNKFLSGGLQKVDIQTKIEALQLSWIKRLNYEHEHQWKTIPKMLLKIYFGNFNVFTLTLIPPTGKWIYYLTSIGILC